MEVGKSRNERPKRLAALKSQQTTRRKILVDTSMDSDASAQSVKVAKVKITTRNKVVERPESPQMYGPTQDTEIVDMTAASRKPPSKRPGPKSKTAKDQRSKPNATFGGADAEVPQSSHSHSIIRKTRSTKETTSYATAKKAQQAKRPVISSEDDETNEADKIDEDEDDDLFVIQQRFFNVRETRSQAREHSKKVGSTSARKDIVAANAKSNHVKASSKKAETLEPRMEIPPTVDLSDEETDTETQFPVADQRDRTPPPVLAFSASTAPVANEFDIGVDNIVQSLLNQTVQRLESTATPEVIPDTPPTSSASTSPDTSTLSSPLPRFPESTSNEEVCPETPNNQSALSHNQNYDTDACASSQMTSKHNDMDTTPDNIANISQDLFTSTQFMEERQNLVGNSAIEDSVDMDSFRRISNQGAHGSSSVQPAQLMTPSIPSDVFMEQNSNSNSRDSNSSVVTVIRSGIKRPACLELVEEESALPTFNGTPLNASRKKPIKIGNGSSSDSSFAGHPSIFLNRLKKKTPCGSPRVRLVSTRNMKRSASASKIDQLYKDRTYGESKSIKEKTPAKPIRYSKVYNVNGSMSDAEDFYIATASVPDDLEDEETVLEESSEINLSCVVDKAGNYRDSITYEDPSILVTLGFEPLRNCKDVITQQLLLKLSTNASVELLENAIRAKGLHSVGDLCSLHILNIQQLPIAPSPRLDAFRKVMTSYAMEHYPTLLSQNQQESSNENNVDQVHEDNESLAQGETDNQREPHVSINTNGVVIEPPVQDPNEDSTGNEGSNHQEIESSSELISRRDKEKLLLELFGGDWLSVVTRLMEEKLTSEERKLVIIKAIQML